MDFKDKLQQYGEKNFGSDFNKRNEQRPAQGKFTDNRGNIGYSSNNNTSSLPNGYLNQGYFNEKGNLHEDLILKHAEEIAKSLGNSALRNDRPNLTYGQLRRFYSHAINAQLAYNSHKNEGLFLNTVKLLDSFVAEAIGKGKVPKVFQDFIKRNVNQIKTARDINDGFMPHFQAVVAYFSGFYKTN